MKNFGILVSVAMFALFACNNDGGGSNDGGGTDIVDDAAFMTRLAQLSCSADDIARWDGTGWVCDTDADVLAHLSCGNGATTNWNAGDWVCGPAVPGTAEIFDAVLDLDNDDSGLNSNFLQGRTAADFAVAAHEHPVNRTFFAAAGSSYEADELIAAVAAANAAVGGGGKAVVNLGPGRFQLPPGVSLVLASGVSLRGAGITLTKISGLDTVSDPQVQEPTILVDGAEVTLAELSIGDTEDGGAAALAILVTDSAPGDGANSLLILNRVHVGAFSGGGNATAVRVDYGNLRVRDSEIWYSSDSNGTGEATEAHGIYAGSNAEAVVVERTHISMAYAPIKNTGITTTGSCALEINYSVIPTVSHSGGTGNLRHSSIGDLSGTEPTTCWVTTLGNTFYGYGAPCGA